MVFLQIVSKEVILPTQIFKLKVSVYTHHSYEKQFCSVFGSPMIMNCNSSQKF